MTTKRCDGPHDDNEDAHLHVRVRAQLSMPDLGGSDRLVSSARLCPPQDGVFGPRDHSWRV
eukprot:7815149-Pyramimonas_sp.AAC.1